jgi:hypothetical protein
MVAQTEGKHFEKECELQGIILPSVFSWSLINSEVLYKENAKIKFVLL